MPKYKVLVGIDYPPNRRAEIGDIVEDIPSKSIKWLREQGIIELADGSSPTVEAPVEEAPVEETPAEEAPAEEGV